MKRKQFIGFLLAALMLLSLAACGGTPAAKADSAPAAQPAAPAAPAADPAPAAPADPAPAPAEPAAPAAETVTVATSPVSETAASPSEIDDQLALIYSKLNDMLQTGGELPWYYTVTDLDHDGQLEFIAASQHPSDRSTNLKIWSVAKDKKSLTECKVSKDPEESFPDIMTDSTDTFHDLKNDTWYYLFYDNVVLSDTEVYTSKSAFNLKNGVMAYDAFAVEHTLAENGTRQVTHTDAEGNDITAAQYNAAGTDAFSGMGRSNTSFDWFTAEQVSGQNRLTDSFMVFMGMKKAAVDFPVPKPAAMQLPAATATPAPSATPVPAPYPTPVPTPVPDPTYLTITKNPTNETKKVGGTAMFVACANAFDSLSWTMVAPYGGEYSTESFASMFPASSVSGVYGTTLSIGNVNWDLNGWGAYCTFYYRGQTARTSTAYIYLRDDPTPPPPSTGTSYGSVTDWGYAGVTVYCSDIGNQWISWDNVNMDGDVYNGAPATVYWSKSGSEINVTWCSITGQSPGPVGPVQGSMAGTAHEGGGGYAIDLENGTQVYVDSWKCQVEGNFYDGCSAVVYYDNYPSNDNIYQAFIYGDMGLIVPDNWDYGDQGGWAGSHYYDTMGGYAGSNYYDNEYYGTDYYDLDDGSVYYEDHDVLGNVLGGGIVYD